MDEIIRANLRMWSDTISFKELKSELTNDTVAVYDKGDNLVTKKGEKTKLKADRNYVSTSDIKIAHEKTAINWIGSKIEEIRKSPFYQHILAGDIQASLWLAIFEPNNILKGQEIRELSQKAQYSNIELLFEDYTNLSENGNPGRHSLGVVRS